jgi:hypothetical protein
MEQSLDSPLGDMAEPRLLSWIDREGKRFARLFPKGGCSYEEHAENALTVITHAREHGALWIVEVPVALLRLPIAVDAEWLRFAWTTRVPTVLMWWCRGAELRPFRVDEEEIVKALRDAATGVVHHDGAPLHAQLERWQRLARSLARTAALACFAEMRGQVRALPADVEASHAHAIDTAPAIFEVRPAQPGWRALRQSLLRRAAILIHTAELLDSVTDDQLHGAAADAE